MDKEKESKSKINIAIISGLSIIIAALIEVLPVMLDSCSKRVTSKMSEKTTFQKDVDTSVTAVSNNPSDIMQQKYKKNNSKGINNNKINKSVIVIGDGNHVTSER